MILAALIQSLPSLPSLPAMPAMPSLGSIPTVVWVAFGVVLLPVIVIFGALAIKVLWGLWPLPLSIAISGYGIYRLGIEWFFLIAVGIAAGIVITMFWQRTKLFLRIDRLLEKGMLLGE